MAAEGFVAAGYTHIQIDDCWQAPHRDPHGAIVADPKRFPSGIKSLAEYVSGKGLSLGLYGDIGTHTCGGFIGFNVSATPDASADAKLAADAETMIGWGISSLKVDGCYADAHTMNVTYPKLGDALKAAAKKAGAQRPWYSCSWPDYVADNLCNHKRTEPCVPLHQIAATCDSARVWMDISDSWNQPTGNGVGVKNYVDFWAKNPQLAQLRNSLPPDATYVNDPDQLMIGNNGLSRTEAEVQMGMWALWGAPMILSTELRHQSMAAEMKAILLNDEVLAISDDALGRQATLCTLAGCHHSSVIYHGATSVWNKTLADGSVAVGLVNLGNFGNAGKAFGDFNVSFTASAVGLAHCKGSRFTARDLFKRTDLGVFEHGFWREIDESSMLLLKIRCVSPATASADNVRVLDSRPMRKLPPTSTEWLDARPFLHGTGFASTDKAHFYDRLPAGAQKTTRSRVWSLSRDSAGLYVQFVSNASSLAVNVTYIYDSFGSWHFPSTGMAGLDLYAYDTSNATWRWLATTNPSKASVGVPLVSTLKAASRGASLVQYRLHLPLYNGVSAVSLGYSGAGAVLLHDPSLRTKKKPIVWYGTSIAQGGVASRPGMAFTNILTRRLDREMLNFGFSGSCLMESGVAQWLAQIDAAAFVIDCTWNMDAALIANRTIPLVHQLRAAAPSIPIVLAEDTEDGTAWAIPTARKKQAAKRANLARAYKTLAPNDHNLHYVKGEQLFALSERVGGVERAVVSPTVGGVHPSDLGMVAIADFYTQFLPPLLDHERVFTESRVPKDETQEAAAAAAEAESRDHVLALHSVQEDGNIVEDVAGASDAAPVVWATVGGPGGLNLMGRAFNDTASDEFFDRLPASARGVVRDPVWNLSRHATGMFAAFRSNGSAIALNYTLDAAAAPLWHMPAAGTSGADLFRYDEAAGMYRYVSALHKFPSSAAKPFVATVASGLDPSGSDRFLLFFPLRAHVMAASIGVHQGSYIRQDAAYADDGFTVNGRKPIVWYGTSIVQGGVASRPGATFTNVLTRSLKRMVLNFGFAGNGRDEVDVAHFLARLPAALIVLDCLPNLNAADVTARTGPLVRFLRANGHATTPIVLAAGTTYGDHWVQPQRNDAKRDALETEFRKLVAAGDQNLHFVANHDDALFARDPLTNPTVGGTHPSDLGHREIAAFYERYLPGLLAHEDE